MFGSNSKPPKPTEQPKAADNFQIVDPLAFQFSPNDFRRLKANLKGLKRLLEPDAATVKADLLIKIETAHIAGLLSTDKIGTILEAARKKRKADLIKRTWIYAKGAFEKALNDQGFTLGQIRSNSEISASSQQLAAMYQQHQIEEIEEAETDRQFDKPDEPNETTQFEIVDSEDEFEKQLAAITRNQHRRQKEAKQ